MDLSQKRYLFISLCLLILIDLILAAEPITSFTLESFNVDDKDQNFGSNFELLGDAQITDKGNFVNLTSPSSGSSSGQLVYKKPFKLIDDNSKNTLSFSSEFTFSITPGDGDGIIFVMFPSKKDLSLVFDQGYFGITDKIDHKFVGVEYDTRKDDNVGDLNGNHVGIDVGSLVSVEISDVSSIGLLLNGGVPLKSWIDFEASSKRLEVRLAESGTDRPELPLISHSVDLWKMWGDKDVSVGISSSSGNSRQISSVSSWSFKTRSVPSSLHSQPLNPEGKVEEVDRGEPTKKSCFLRVLGAVIFATGCGTLVAFLVLFVWVLLYGRHLNVSPELPMNQMDFKYEKVNVTVDNGADDGHNTTT